MRRPQEIAAGVLVACVLALAPGTALAQEAPEALSGDKPQPLGFKIGPGRLHIFLTEGLTYNSAALVVPTNQAGTTFAVEGEVILHTRPGVNLEVDTANNGFGLNAYIDYLWYTGWVTPGSNAASRLDAAADLHGDFNREGVVGLAIGDTFSRSANTYTPSVAVGVISLYNQARLAIPIRPGGRALEIIPHVAYGVELFSQYSGVGPGACPPGSPCNPATLEQYNYQDLTSGLDVRLKFLPETAAFLTINYDARFYSNTTINPNASELKSQIGLAGLVTTKLQVLLKAGWAQGFGPGSISTVIGQAEVTWLATELANLSVGFLRDVYPVSGNGSYIDDRPYLSGKIFLGGRLSLSITAAYDFFDFAEPDPGTTTTRNDSQFSVNAVAEYQILRWLTAGAGFLVIYHTSTVPVDTLNYTQWQPYVQVTFTY